MTWGEWPRQRSGVQTAGSSLTLQEQFQMREEARGRLDAASASMYEPRIMGPQGCPEARL